MGKEKTLSGTPASAAPPGMFSGLARELFTAALYKPSQGKAVRQATFVALAGLVCVAAYQLFTYLSVTLKDSYESLKYAVPLTVLLLGVWISFRVVNLPRFADFLIAVQAEMNKVSWPSKQELIRASLVVIVVIFLLSIILFSFDLFWVWLFQMIGVLKP